MVDALSTPVDMWAFDATGAAGARNSPRPARPNGLAGSPSDCESASVSDRPLRIDMDSRFSASYRRSPALLRAYLLRSLAPRGTNGPCIPDVRGSLQEGLKRS